ncbi:MAG: ABC transporter substrate-binding protein, partial [Candidatus Fimimonas sp.]
AACVNNTVKDTSFRIVTSWEKSGIRNHFYSGSDIGSLQYFMVEGLYRIVRSTGEIDCELADGMPVHYTEGENYCTNVKIKQNAKWQNGEDFLAEDVLAFYHINHTTATNYMLDIEEVNDHEIKITWNPQKLPVESVRNLLIAQDRQGTCKYSEFKTYVDLADRLVSSSPLNTNPDWFGAYNRASDPETLAMLDANYRAYQNHNPSWFVATGPYTLKIQSATQVQLEKNPYHWAAENLSFDTINAYSSSDINQTYNLLANDKIDYMDGVIPYDSLRSILENNRNLVHLKMYDPGSVGLLFNMKKGVWQDKVREAFQYIFDREEIKNAANPYALTSEYALLGMCETEARTYMSQQNFNSLTKYGYDEAKASKLLIEAGWSYKDGSWYFPSGQKAKLTLGVDNGNVIHSAVAEAVQSMLNLFGIEVTLKKSAQEAWFTAASQVGSEYDFSVHWTDLNPTSSFPSGSLEHFQNYMSHICQMDRYPSTYPIIQLQNGLTLPITDVATGQKFAFADKMSSFYSQSGDNLENMVSSYVTSMSQANLGVQFFQNVTGSFINVAKVDGVPLKEYWSQTQDVTYLPQVGSDEYYAVAKTNLYFAGAWMFTSGTYKVK